MRSVDRSAPVARRALAVFELVEHIVACSDTRSPRDFAAWRLVNRTWAAAVEAVAVSDIIIASRHRGAYHSTITFGVEHLLTADAAHWNGVKALETQMNYAQLFTCKEALLRMCEHLPLCTNLYFLSTDGNTFHHLMQGLDGPLCRYTPSLKEVHIWQPHMDAEMRSFLSGASKLSHLSLFLPSKSDIESTGATFMDSVALTVTHLTVTVSASYNSNAKLVEALRDMLAGPKKLSYLDLCFPSANGGCDIQAVLPEGLQQLRLDTSSMAMYEIFQILSKKTLFDGLATPPELAVFVDNDKQLAPHFHLWISRAVMSTMQSRAGKGERDTCSRSACKPAGIHVCAGLQVGSLPPDILHMSSRQCRRWIRHS